MRAIGLAVMGVTVAVATACGVSDPRLPPIATPTMATKPLPPPDWVLEMHSYVERLTGPDAVDCGQHMLRRLEGADEETLRQSISCGLAAARTRKAFWTFKQNLSEDSNFAEGLAGTPDGVIYRFTYDSPPGRRITVEPCTKPAAGTNSDHRTQFQCLRQERREQVP